jgi:hypothetical protein
MSTAVEVIDLADDTETEEETDNGSDLEGFVIPDDDVEEMVNTTPEEDETCILEQYDKVKDMGTQFVGGCRRSTRVRKATERYRDPDFEKVMFSSGDELSDVSDVGDEDSGVEYCVDDDYTDGDYTDDDA